MGRINFGPSEPRSINCENAISFGQPIHQVKSKVPGGTACAVYEDQIGTGASNHDMYLPSVNFNEFALGRCTRFDTRFAEIRASIRYKPKAARY